MPRVILICVLACGVARSDDASLRNDWLQAPKTQGANWNRAPLMERLMKGLDMTGMPRAKVLALLGPAGYTAEDYPGPSRIEIYRLSAANDKSLRVDYDSADKVLGYFVESSACSCDACAAGAPVLPSAVLDKSGLTRTTAAQRSLTMSAFEKLVGRPGQLNLSHNQVGGQMWLNYSETWRVGGAPHQFLIVDGHTPARDGPMDAIADKPAYSWALVSIAPDCIAK